MAPPPHSLTFYIQLLCGLHKQYCMDHRNAQVPTTESLKLLDSRQNIIFYSFLIISVCPFSILKVLYPSHLSLFFHIASALSSGTASGLSHSMLLLYLDLHAALPDDPKHPKRVLFPPGLPASPLLSGSARTVSQLPRNCLLSAVLWLNCGLLQQWSSSRPIPGC